MNLYRTLKQTGIRLSLLLLLISSLSFSSPPITFNDVASTVIMNSLQSLPQNHFLRQLYAPLLFSPLWVGEEHLSTTAEALLDEIGEDKTLSDLSPLKQDAFAFRQQAESLYITEGTLKEKIRLEFKISQLYWAYAKYRLYGGIDWRKFDLQLHTLKKRGINAAWVTYRPEFTPISLLGQVISGNGLSEMFAKSKPHEYHYDALEQALCQYRQIANQGGWKPLFFRGRLKPGRAYKIIPALRERLRLSGDYQGCEAPESNLYDTCLKKAVIRFQKRHGLVAKGVIGKTTRKALNVPVEVRIKTIQLNLDRIKWLHQHHAQRSITINIPAFRLFFEEEGVLIQTMRVITGRIKNPTPVFSNIVETIVLNPSWNIPKSIIQKEMIPKLLRDPNAMAKRGIEIHKGWGKNAMKIQGGAVDWTRYRYSKIMPFHFAQVPGYRNALGKVKFLFPNRFSVYMHDTPTKRLFKRNIRAFSHGCIRLQKPRELLKTFSSFNDSIDFQKSQKRLKGNKKAYLKLDNQVPVDIVYLTAYVDYDGVLNFRKDIYGYDKMQLRFYRNW